MPRNQPRPPAQIARLVELLELSGLDATSFARKIGASGATLLFWSKGRKSSGDRWEALEAEIARRRGAGLAALMNAGLAVDAPAAAPAQVAPSPEPAKPVAVDAAPSAPAANEPPAQERSGRTTLAGDCERIVEILRDLGGRAKRTVEKVTTPTIIGGKNTVKETTVVVKDEDLVTKSIESMKNSVVAVR
jgi:hypothetical protein